MYNVHSLGVYYTVYTVYTVFTVIQSVTTFYTVNTIALHCLNNSMYAYIYYQAYLIFVIIFTRAKFLENKIYTEKTRKLRQNTQKIDNFSR